MPTEASLPASLRSLDAMELAGDVGFDPLGFSDPSKGPFDNGVAHMAYIREAEIKHGALPFKEAALFLFVAHI